MQFYIRINQIWKNACELILSKVDNISKIEWNKVEVNTTLDKKFWRNSLTYSNWNVNANIEIFFAIFSKTTFWTYVVHDLDGSIGLVHTDARMSSIIATYLSVNNVTFVSYRIFRSWISKIAIFKQYMNYSENYLLYV